ncbi:MAG: GNAT family N-acetyltransferase [Rhizobiales bacterium]|nr:GNAT family N-acetyltransferase [Hyphomicrobiales bacterium]
MEISRLAPADFDKELPGLTALLHACVLDGASIGFILPFTMKDAEGFWRYKVFPTVAQKTRIVLTARIDEETAGTVQLDYDTPGNQLHRAEVRKLLVHPEFRRRGIAKALMAEVEAMAIGLGRSLITLDTRTNDMAEPLYTGIGYKIAGIIPGYCRDTLSDRLDPTTVMYKNL